jgi:hypothetical protein
VRIFTWHTHGRYLQSLSNLQHDIFLPYRPARQHPYGGRGDSFRLPRNVYEVPVEFVKDLDLDCLIFQTKAQYEEEQFAILTPDQRRLPRIFIEHDPPLAHPTELRHPVQDPGVLLVHVTAFNQLMWHSPGIESTVIEHGVQMPPGVRYTGELDSGIAAVNNIHLRGRRLGLDVLRAVQELAPIHVVGMGSEAIGGHGEVAPLLLAEYESHYRFYLNPMRWTSMSMAACEAMLLGMPLLTLATTEMATVVRQGENGYMETDPVRLGEHARRLAADPAEAAELGRCAKQLAESRFGIRRFVSDWDHALERAVEIAGSTHAADASKAVAS